MFICEAAENECKEEVEGNKSFWSLFPLHYQASFKNEITICLNDPYTMIFKYRAYYNLILLISTERNGKCEY